MYLIKYIEVKKILFFLIPYASLINLSIINLFIPLINIVYYKYNMFPCIQKWVKNYLK